MKPIARRKRDWTDAGAHDPGIALLELAAYVADQLSSYQDQVAAEARLRTRLRWALVIGALVAAVCVRRQLRLDSSDDATHTSGT